MNQYAYDKINIVLLKQKLVDVIRQLGQLPLKVSIPVSLGIFVAVTYGVVFFIEKPVTFSYSGATCVRQMTLFPHFISSRDTSRFTAQYSKSWQVGGVDLASFQTCFTPVVAPAEGVTKVSLSPWGGPIARKTFAIAVDAAPRANISVLDAPIAAGKSMTIPLTATDVIYRYALTANQQQAVCEPGDKLITCDVASLQLKQDEVYTLTLHREWADTTVAKLVSKEVRTLPATKIKKADIKNKQTIYKRPKSFTFEFDQSVKSAEVTLKQRNGKKKTLVVTDTALKANTMTVTPKKELARNTTYDFRIANLEAVDGSTLIKPYEATFKMSGGPKLQNSNIDATGAGLTQTVILTFDQPLSATQDITKLVTVSGGIRATVSKRGTQVFVKYIGADKCVDFTITIAKGIKSKYEVAQTKTQRFSSRTVCHTVETIGYSANGRPINAFFFGSSGGKTVLFTGAIHGNEVSSKYTMDSWINELDANARRIPKGKQIVVIPMVSPDGFLAGDRFNANDVNLNRNWPTYNWEKDGGDGGESPLSEPETRALANFTKRLQPVFVATYHAQGRIVNSNDVGNSRSLGKRYASMLGYRFVADAQTAEVFGENITGTYEDWLKERGTACILMELDATTGNYFNAHKLAMWMLVNNY